MRGGLVGRIWGDMVCGWRGGDKGAERVGSFAFFLFYFSFLWLPAGPGPGPGPSPGNGTGPLRCKVARRSVPAYGEGRLNKIN